MSKENSIRIREAIKFAKDSGKDVRKGELANKVFLYTSPSSAYQRLYNYSTGESTMIDRRTVNLLCKELGVDANFLFGTPPMEQDE